MRSANAAADRCSTRLRHPAVYPASRRGLRGALVHEQARIVVMTIKCRYDPPSSNTTCTPSAYARIHVSCHSFLTEQTFRLLHKFWFDAPCSFCNFLDDIHLPEGFIPLLGPLARLQKKHFYDNLHGTAIVELKKNTKAVSPTLCVKRHF